MSKLERIKKIGSDFCLATSFHALPGIARAKSIFMKIIWIVFLAIAIGACSYNILENVQGYQNYETFIQKRVIVQKKVKFPAVYICPVIKESISLDELFIQCEYDLRVYRCRDIIEPVVIGSSVGEKKNCFKINGG